MVWRQMAAFWDIVGKVANLFQLFGLDAITLIAVATSFLRFHEVKKECRKLEERVQMLQLLLRFSASCWTMQQHLELGHLVTNGLKDAHHLVESYKESTLFLRVRRARSTATQFRVLRSSIDSCCGLILSINACLLILQADPPPPPLVRARTEFNDGDVPPSAGNSIDAETCTAAPDTHIINVSQELVDSEPYMH